MRDTVPRVKHDPRSPARGVQRQDSLDTDIEGRGVEGLKQNLKSSEWRFFCLDGKRKKNVQKGIEDSIFTTLCWYRFETG